MKKWVFVAAISFSLLNVAHADVSGVSDAIKRNAQEIYNSSMSGLSELSGGKSESGIPRKGEVRQSTTQSPHFEAVKDWLNNQLRASDDGQVRVVITPEKVECKTIMGHVGLQCTGTSTARLFFAPSKGIGDWGKFIASPYALSLEVTGPAYKTDGGAGVALKVGEANSDFSTALIMLSPKPYDYASGHDRAGPAVPANHNWLPDNILSKKSGYTGNAKGFYSEAEMLHMSVSDVLSSFNLQSFIHVIYWVN